MNTLDSPAEPEVEYAELARAESERGELALRERRQGSGPSVLELRANGVFVTDTREVGSELALATAGLAAVEKPAAVVVAGLGLGFTLREVLSDPRVERAAVVEIEESLVAWMRDGTISHGPALLADERVSVVVADIGSALAEARPATYDLVLLDVDNGPDYLVHDDNAAPYRRAFLESVRAALRPGGAVAVWSPAASTALEQALAAMFGHYEVRSMPVALQEREERYWLYLGRA